MAGFYKKMSRSAVELREFHGAFSSADKGRGSRAASRIPEQRRAAAVGAASTIMKNEKGTTLWLRLEL